MKVILPASNETLTKRLSAIISELPVGVCDFLTMDMSDISASTRRGKAAAALKAHARLGTGAFVSDRDRRVSQWGYTIFSLAFVMLLIAVLCSLCASKWRVVRESAGEIALFCTLSVICIIPFQYLYTKKVLRESEIVDDCEIAKFVTTRLSEVCD